MSNFYIPEYDCVFIHIPKTGGLSIRKGFFNRQYNGPFKGKIPQRYAHCFSFAFIRNPYNRLISAWKMLTRDWQNLPQLSLKDFLTIVTDESIGFRGGNTFKNYNVSVRHHTLPQTHPFNCLHLAKFVGRFENLEKDFEQICKRINCEYKPLPTINQSVYEKDIMEYFDQQTLDTVNNYYNNDFSLGYTKIGSI